MIGPLSKYAKGKEGAGDIGEGLNGPKRQCLLVYDRKKSGKLVEGKECREMRGITAGLAPIMI